MAACYMSPVTLTLVHSALQERAASETPLDQSARVCLLMHVGVAQASTRMQQEGPLVRLSLDQDLPNLLVLMRRS
jgi:hypothetical protein